MGKCLLSSLWFVHTFVRSFIVYVLVSHLCCSVRCVLGKYSFVHLFVGGGGGGGDSSFSLRYFQRFSHLNTFFLRCGAPDGFVSFFFYSYSSPRHRSCALKMLPFIYLLCVSLFHFACARFPLCFYALNDFLSQTYIICGSGNAAAAFAAAIASAIHNK